MQSENGKNTAMRYADSRILIGNWNEENFAKEEKFRKFLLKRDRGNLIFQKTEQILSHFLKEVRLEVPCDFLRFGSIIQLEAPEMKKIDSTKDESLVVSISMDGVMVNQIPSVCSHCILSLAPSIRPCVRNTFIITSPDDVNRTNEVLKYNQDFNLKCMDSDELICSTPKMDSTLGRDNYNMGDC